MTEQKMAQLIGEELEKRGISQAEFCRQVGVSTKHMDTVLTGKASARTAQLDYWAFVLGMHFSVRLVKGLGGQPTTAIQEDSDG